MKPLTNNEKLSVVFDDSGDQPERFPNDYYIVCVLTWSESGCWYNTGFVWHVASLAEMDALLAERANKGS